LSINQRKAEQTQRVRYVDLSQNPNHSNEVHQTFQENVL
jgi:hypothetical protein